MRDKLIDLLSENFVDFCHVVMVAGNCKISAVTLEADKFADHLISLGVTIADVPDNNVGNKPMTNGDRIRAMTDEELAEFILDKRENGTCFNNKCYYYDPNKGCDDCTLEWLKQPVR